MSKTFMLFVSLLIFCSCNNGKNEKRSDTDSTENSKGLPPEDNHIMENNVSPRRKVNIDEEKLRTLDSIRATQEYSSLADTAMVMLDTTVKK